MSKTRNIILNFITISLIFFAVSLITNQSIIRFKDNKIVLIFDLEDSAEHHEDHKSVKKIKDLDNAVRYLMNLEHASINTANQYNQFYLLHLEDITIDVVTPPPESC